MRPLLRTLRLIRLARHLPLLAAARAAPFAEAAKHDLWRAHKWEEAHHAQPLPTSTALEVLDRRQIRSVLLARLYHQGGRWRAWHSVLTRISPGEPTLEIGTPFGAGLRVAHGYGAVLHPKAMGENVTVYQGVTIGHTEHGAPVIGNRVRIFAHAQILGPITVGDDTVIAAGAIVLQDVPAGMLAAGVPARIVGKASEPVNL